LGKQGSRHCIPEIGSKEERESASAGVGDGLTVVFLRFVHWGIVFTRVALDFA
jgi:hypothetical protein